MRVRDAFGHRSGRVISLGRSLLASFFLIVLWADTGQPASGGTAVYAFLGAYAAAALIHMVATWDNWWLDNRLAGPAHVVDLLAFTALNFVTHGYASPFFTFFVFLLLAASIRWGWRETAFTAAAIILLYLVEGAIATRGGGATFDLARFTIRSSYLVVLSSMIILWFASKQQPPRSALALAGSRWSDAMEEIVREGARRFGCASAILFWSDADEPWSWVGALRDGGYEQRSVTVADSGALVDPGIAEGPFVFDLRSGRVLQRRGRRLIAMARRAAVRADVAAECGVAEGLAISLRTRGGCGLLLVTGVDGLCSDDLVIAKSLAADIASALEHRALLDATEEATAMRARLTFARDIHDSTAQFLAGLAMRLEGVRTTARGGGEISDEIDALQDALAREQRELRGFIETLRGERPSDVRVDLVTSLRELAGRMSSQWSIDCEIESSHEPLPVGLALERNVQQLVREAVANAVRHGEARRVTAQLRQDGTVLALHVSDDGRGFPGPPTADHPSPRSMRERVHQLGGTVRVGRCERGATLSITLPLECEAA